MERPPDVDALLQLYLFRTVPARALAELCSLAPPVRYATGDVVFRQGDPADVGVLLVDGKLVVSVRVGEVVRQVGDVKPGEIVGETALFSPNGKRSATVVAAVPSTALKLSWYMLERAPQNPAVIALEQHLLGALVRRIRKTNQAIQAEWRYLGGPLSAPQPAAPQSLATAHNAAEPASTRRAGLLGRLMGLFGENG